MLIISEFLNALANMKEVIYQKILYLVIVGICKMYTNMQNQICNHFDDLINPEKQQTKIIYLIKKKLKQKDSMIYLTRYLTLSQ